jgi:hypothetical protein
MGNCSGCCGSKDTTPNSEVTIESLMKKPGAKRSVLVIQSVMASYLESKRINKIKYRRSIQGGKPGDSRADPAEN